MFIPLTILFRNQKRDFMMMCHAFTSYWEIMSYEESAIRKALNQIRGLPIHTGGVYTALVSEGGQHARITNPH